MYLQFDHGTTPGLFLGDSSQRRFGQAAQKWPHAVVGVQGLVNRQKYDVSVEMTVPRSRSNLDAGNWMLDLSLRSHASSSGIKSMLGWDDDAVAEPTVLNGDTVASASKPTVLAHSRRPAILTYRSWPIEHLYRLLRLPLYLSGFGSESETLHLTMLEAAYFPSAVPTSLRLELRSRAPLEVYRVRVHISAKLEGLRWLMYQHRLASAAVCVLLFWGTEMGVLMLTWGLASTLFGSSSSSRKPDGDDDDDDDDALSAPNTPRIKKEAHADDPGTPHSDTSHTFPALSGHQALRYSSPSSSSKPKYEDSAEPRLEDIPLREDAEADDEDDDFVLQEPVPRGEGALFTDSGLGTGMDSERDRERERVRRRGSARGRGKGDER